MRVTLPIWKRTVKVNGEETTVFSGPFIGDYQVTIWPVRERKSEKSPTHELVISERRKEDSGDGGPF